MRILLWILGALLGLFLLAVIAVFLLVDAERIRPQLAAAMERSLGRPVSIGELDLSLLRLAFAARDLRIGEDPGFGEEPFVSTEALRLDVALMPLLREGRIHVGELLLDGPRVRLAQGRDGRWNFSTLAGATESTPVEAAGIPPLAIDRLRLRDGMLTIVRSGRPPREYSDLNLEVDDLDPARAVPFRLSVRPAAGGRLSLSGQVGPVVAGNPAATPVEADIEIAGLDLARLLAEAGNTDTGLAGTLDLTGTARIAAGRFDSGGQAQVTALRLIESGAPSPQPLRLDYRIDYDLDAQRGHLGESSLRLGNAALGLSGSLDNRGASPKLDLGLTGKGLRVDEVQALLPMLAVALPESSRLGGGTLDLSLRVRGDAEALVISGPVSLANTRLAGFSLGQRMGQALAVAGLRAPADTVIRKASADLRVDDGGVAMERIQAEVAEFGSLTGNGRIGADESLDFRFTARLAEEAIGESGLGGRLGGALQAALKRGRSEGIGVRVTGTAATPAFAVDQASLTRIGASAALGAALSGQKGAALDTEEATETLKQKAVESLFKRLGSSRKKEEDDRN